MSISLKSLSRFFKPFRLGGLVSGKERKEATRNYTPLVLTKNFSSPPQICIVVLSQAYARKYNQENKIPGVTYIAPYEFKGGRGYDLIVVQDPPKELRTSMGGYHQWQRWLEEVVFLRRNPWGQVIWTDHLYAEATYYITGRRASRIIMDDPFAPEDPVTVERHRELAKDWFNYRV